MVFTTEGLFEVAIESWPEWDLNPRKTIIFDVSTSAFFDKYLSYNSH